MSVGPRHLAAIAAVVAFVVALVMATRREAQVRCEVCVVFGGAEACRSAAGADRDAAVRGAVSNACAVLASGVTQSLECDRSVPRSVRCED